MRVYIVSHTKSSPNTVWPITDAQHLFAEWVNNWTAQEMLPCDTVRVNTKPWGAVLRILPPLSLSLLFHPTRTGLHLSLWSCPFKSCPTNPFETLETVSHETGVCPWHQSSLRIFLCRKRAGFQEEFPPAPKGENSTYVMAFPACLQGQQRLILSLKRPLKPNHINGT